jgi:hypothetical protein
MNKTSIIDGLDNKIIAAQADLRNILEEWNRSILTTTSLIVVPHQFNQNYIHKNEVTGFFIFIQLNSATIRFNIPLSLFDADSVYNPIYVRWSYNRNKVYSLNYNFSDDNKKLIDELIDAIEDFIEQPLPSYS